MGFFKLQENTPFIPQNYRETSFYFEDKKKPIFVVALAKPDVELRGPDSEKTQNPTLVMEYLKKQNVSVLFGLEGSPKLANLAANCDMHYVDITIKDFTAPEVEVFDLVYRKVQEEAGHDKKIGIHCKGGNGRTGTILVALMLKELSFDKSFNDVSDKRNHSVNTLDGPVECTENVSKAINALRATPGNKHAVEVSEQVEVLMKYEQQLRQECSSKPEFSKTSLKS